MSVLEILQVKVKDSISPRDPAILKSLKEVRSSLASRVQRTNSQFWTCIEDPTLIYVFGIWPSVAAHRAFLASPLRPALLSPQEELLDFAWVMHMPLPSMGDLPLDAHVMSMARFFVRGREEEEEEVGFQRLRDGRRRTLVDATKPYWMVEGWRCDAEPGKREMIVFSGWESMEAREEFMEKAMKDPEYDRMENMCDGVEIRHMRNMES